MSHSAFLYHQAQDYMPGGVNSPVRAFRGVGGNPIFFERGEGAYVFDVDNKLYIDYVGSWGPLVLGHAHPAVIAAVQKTITKGLTFGAPTELEILLAKKVCELMPHVEMVRMVNSGTEATMSAIRLARGFTQRNKIVKFNGCYHGHSDALLAKAGSGVLTLGLPDSAGVPADFTKYTITADYNNLEQVHNIFAEYGNDIAAIIIEPIVGNMNFVMPVPGFLAGLRELCDHYHSLLIFDEVMTGFRVALGGAQAHFNIKPDLTTLGKIIGGGMPVGAFGGRKDIMEMLAPIGPVYQAGTLSGNPVAMAAGLATLNEISKPNFHSQLNETTQQLINGLIERADAANIPFTGNCLGGMFGFFFTSEKTITTFEQVKRCNSERFKQFYHAMLTEGIYWAPSMFEAGFTSIKHDAEIINKTLLAAEKVFKSLK